MIKRHISLILILFVLFGSMGHPVYAENGVQNASLQITDPYALVDAVNAFRVQNGLAPYSINPTLMAIAQSHASFMASNGVSHYGVGGSRPFERALAAGYPLAGDLTQGGFFSENITAGINKSVTDAVVEWQGDAPHLNTMLSASLTEIGAGMVSIDGYIYYVIDCGRPTNTGEPQVIPTSMAGVIDSIPLAPVVVNTLVPSTPDAQGRVIHIVASGETLWLIGVSYGITAQQIRDANPAVYGDEIFVGQKLYLPGAKTATPAPPTAIAQVTEGAVTPTLTPFNISTPSLPTITSQPDKFVTPIIDEGYIIGEELSNGTSGLIGLLMIVVIGVFLAILLMMLTRRHGDM